MCTFPASVLSGGRVVQRLRSWTLEPVHMDLQSGSAASLLCDLLQNLLTNHSVPSFPHLLNGDNYRTYLVGLLRESKKLPFIKPVKHCLPTQVLDNFLEISFSGTRAVSSLWLSFPKMTTHVFCRFSTPFVSLSPVNSLKFPV